MSAISFDGSSLPWSEGLVAEEEEADLKSFDIGVMPSANDPVERKCGLKISVLRRGCSSRLHPVGE
jgi:hypothetical protein